MKRHPFVLDTVPFLGTILPVQYLQLPLCGQSSIEKTRESSLRRPVGFFFKDNIL